MPMNTQPFVWSLAAAAALAAVPFLRSSSPPLAGGDESAALKAVDEAFVQAFNKKDVDGVLACYADDAVVMDPGPALIYRGKEEIKKGFGEFFRTQPGAQLKLGEAHYKNVGDLGYGYILWTITLNGPEGSPMEMKGRATDVMEKRGGKWVLVTDHASFPVPAAPTAGTPAPAKAPAKK
jgi:uncharacterized protein (TIGR02246 family)